MFYIGCQSLSTNIAMTCIICILQVVNSGASLYVCYGCLSVVNKLVYYNKPDALHGLIKDINVAR